MTTDGLDAVFSALADPTRRRLVDRLAEDGPQTATTLAQGLPMTRQAVVHHLQSLADAGLVATARQGREVHYRATPGPLNEAATWMQKTGAEWEHRLARLREQLGGLSPDSAPTEPGQEVSDD